MSDLADIMHAIAARDEYVDLKIAAAIRDARNAALEEAARACRRVADVAARKGRDYVVDGLIPEARLQAGRVEGADDCAAAIRALIPKEAK